MSAIQGFLHALVVEKVNEPIGLGASSVVPSKTSVLLFQLKMPFL